MARLVREAVEAGALGFSTSRTIGHRAIDGEPVPAPTRFPDGKTNGNYWFLDQKLQQSGGKPIELTIEEPNGGRRTAQIHPVLGRAEPNQIQALLQDVAQQHRLA